MLLFTEMKLKAFVTGAPASGSGKTTLTLALARAFCDKGLAVAPFKVGPDYIDPGFLAKAARRPCYNLDLWMCGKDGLRRSFSRGACFANIAVIEGAMGLFDGPLGKTPSSTAEVAKALKIPVLLVLSAKGAAQTLAALALGLKEYDPALKIAGAVITEVASSRQEAMIAQAFSQSGIKLYGFFPRLKDFIIPRRHLGLVLAEEISDEMFETLGKEAAKNIDLEGLIQDLPEIELENSATNKPFQKARIAVAKDRAFCFYYQENLDLLEEYGAELVFFSPSKDDLPEAQGYYFGGGYPELFAKALAEKKALHKELKARVQKGVPILAECGGFIFLNRLLKLENSAYPLVGILPGEVVLGKKLKALGYRTLLPEEDNFLGRGPFFGHEFRYSSLKNGFQKGFKAFDAEEKEVKTFGLVKENIFATYIHLHFGRTPKAAANFVAYASQVK